ncbi:MAG: hypothetical protein AAB949_02055 [Patescibacteria group bacterium]
MDIPPSQNLLDQKIRRDAWISFGLGVFGILPVIFFISLFILILIIRYYIFHILHEGTLKSIDFLFTPLLISLVIIPYYFPVSTIISIPSTLFAIRVIKKLQLKGTTINGLKLKLALIFLGAFTGITPLIYTIAMILNYFDIIRIGVFHIELFPP